MESYELSEGFSEAANEVAVGVSLHLTGSDETVASNSDTTWVVHSVSVESESELYGTDGVVSPVHEEGADTLAATNSHVIRVFTDGVQVSVWPPGTSEIPPVLTACEQISIHVGNNLVLTEPISGHSITLQVPNWTVNFEHKWLGVTKKLLDGEARAFAGFPNSQRRKRISTRKYPINLTSWTQKQNLMTFVRAHVGKTITVSGYLESTAKSLMLDTPMLEIEEIEKISLVESGVLQSNASLGATTLNIIDTTGTSDRFLTLAVRRPSDNWYSWVTTYTVLRYRRAGGVLSVTIKEGLNQSALSGSKVYMYDGLGAYSTMLSFSEIA